MTTPMICFEQPMNEQIRACLKLEQLFKHLQRGLQDESELSSRVALESVVQILNVLDRPDFKSKLVKELQRLRNNIVRFASANHIDHNKLESLLTELDGACEGLHSISGKLGQQLRSNEFLNMVRQQLLNPGGVCGFELPAYWLWLNQAANLRIVDLKIWYQEFEMLRSIVNLLLKLIRESTTVQSRVAEAGFYQTNLDPSLPVQLLQIYLPKQVSHFPEISLGRHGISMRFYQISNQTGRRQVVTQDVAFKIAICAI